ncbi:MAG: response regulator transcription factor [Bacteroidetes bacterium]|nr:response regulator transcription factor [Bacteroidota bacterium]
MRNHNIAIADDHQLFTDGIAEFIPKIPYTKIVFTVNTTTQLIKKLKRHRVDILILDLNLPPDNGLQLIEPLRTIYPNMKIFILSMYQPIDVDQDIATLNADAYVLKTSGKEVLLKALDALIENKRFIDPNLNNQPARQDVFTMTLKLTKREKDIVNLIAKGKSNKEIAESLFLSELTVKTHRKNIKNKLGADGKSDLIFKSIRLFY